MPNIAHYSHNVDTHESEKDNKAISLDITTRSKRSPRRSVVVMPTIVRKKVTPPPSRCAAGAKPRPGKPLYHLKGRESWKYTDIEELSTDIEQLNNDPMLFKISLEILNRRSVRQVLRPHHDDEITEIAQYFFECIEKAKVSLKMCTQCRDIDKDRTITDWYFMDLVEISQQRTILCLDCMEGLVKSEVKGTPQDIAEELLELREKQPNGIYMDPFLISCGY